MLIISLLLLTVSPIQIDGQFQDWSAGVAQTQDEHYLYQRITLEENKCLQQLPTPLHLDLGGYEIVFSPKDPSYGVACYKDGKQISPYDIGLVFAPTVASAEFEIRIDKPNSSKVTVPFVLTEAKTESLRVVSWNVQFGNLLDEVDRGTRILQALKPDILLLQELDGDDSPEKVQTFLHDALGGSWTVFMSKVWGTQRHERLRSAIATQLPCTQVVPSHRMPLKVVMADVEVDGTTITFVSLHLRCCGGPTSEAEARRQEEAGMIRRAINELASEESQRSGVVLAGDWNLVGTDKPLLEVLADDLKTVNAYQPDGLLTATWSDAASPFTPGRLDWMLHSKDTLHVQRAFVLDTSDLDKESLQTFNIHAHDTASISDHLPLVADLRYK